MMPKKLLYFLAIVMAFAMLAWINYDRTENIYAALGIVSIGTIYTGVIQLVGFINFREDIFVVSTGVLALLIAVGFSIFMIP